MNTSTLKVDEGKELTTTATTSTTTTTTSNPDSSSSFIEKKYDEQSIQGMVQEYLSWKRSPNNVSVERLEQITEAFQRMLWDDSSELDNLVKELVEAGAIPCLVMMLHLTDHPNLVLHATMALTNVAATSFAPVLVANQPDCVPQLANLLMHQIPSLREQAGWCLGNIAGSSISFRDAVLATPRVIEGMVKNLEDIANEPMLEIITRATCNMLHGKPVVPLHQVRPFLPAMINILNVCEAKDVVPKLRVNTAWGLAFITEGGNDYVQAALDCGLVAPLMTIIRKHSRKENLAPTLRAIGNAVAGTDEMKAAVLKEGLLDDTINLLLHRSNSVRKYTCWMISNIAAGTAQQCQQIMATGSDYQVIETLVKYGIDGCWDVRKEAVCAIGNLITNLPLPDLHLLLNGSGALRVLEHALCMESETKLVLVVLNALERVFKECGENVTASFVGFGGLHKLKKLQFHPSDEIYKTALRLIGHYFGGGDDVVDAGDENVAPAAVHDDSFDFCLEDDVKDAGDENDAPAAVHDDSFDFCLEDKLLVADGQCSPMSPTSF